MLYSSQLWLIIACLPIILFIGYLLCFRGKYPFGDYIAYPNFTFTMKEIKHLWRQNSCESKYGRHLTMRTDDFEKPAETNVLCSNWKKWKQPIIWYSENAISAYSLICQTLSIDDNVML